MSVENSKILEILSKKAKGYNYLSDSSVTVEGFWLAVIDLYTGDISCDASDEDALGVGKLVGDIKLDYNGAHKFLEGLLEKGDYKYHISSVEMQIVFYNLKNKAEKENKTLITATEVLNVILRESLGATKELLKRFVSNGAAAPAATGTATPAAKPNPVFIKQQLSVLASDVKRLRNTLSSTVFGQENAINIFATGYFQAQLTDITDKNRTKPLATYLFAGPPGVGKTFLAEQIASELKLPYMRFDMSEYGDHNAIVDFCGSDSVYKSAKEGDVTGFVSRNPRSIILFDEVEKAHLNIIHLFLQLLDAGRLRDNYTGNTVSFKDVIVILTTNAGRDVYEGSDASDFSNLPRKVILKAIENDKKPGTDTPFFPTAICSRFASGNVVMFNHITAHNLIGIARRGVEKAAEGFGRETGINIDIDENIYASILFSEGGTADARTIKARATGFFDSEIYELLRLLDENKISSIENIKLSVQLPENKEILNLFKSVEKPEIMAFTTKEIYKKCTSAVNSCNFHLASDLDEAIDIIKKKEIGFVLLDLMFDEQNKAKKYLNIEDVISPSRNLFKYLRENHIDMPIYLLEKGEAVYTEEERVSFFGQGVRGVITMSDTDKSFAAQIENICQQLTYHKSMLTLAKANKVISYETAQTISEDGKNAEITLFDFKESVAVSAEDAKDILSNISRPDVTFDKVIGAEDAKSELKYFVEFLKNPKKYMGTGVRAPKGVLLYGPPGTGKTLLAKALAKEADVTFISAQGNQFLSKWIGEGAEMVHNIFRTARKYAPAVLFIDEIDSIGAERTGNATRSEEGTLTALLTEMDGFKNDATKPVFVLAATNYGVDENSSAKLDAALLRRFDRKIFVDLPTSDERIQYLKLKIEGNPIFDISGDEYENIAVRSTGMSLANLENVLELAMRMAIRSGTGMVTDELLDEAFEVSKYGEEKPWDVSLLERTARHEAGHAFVCWYGGEVPAYVTVVAREGHGGYMGHADRRGMNVSTRKDLLARIRTSLAGRATELVYYGEEEGLTTGASGDLANSTYFAERMVCSYGMDEEFGLAVVDTQKDAAMLPYVRPIVNKILANELENTKKIISENRAAIDAIVEVLMDKNHLTGPEIDALFSKYAKMEQK